MDKNVNNSILFKKYKINIINNVRRALFYILQLKVNNYQE